MSRSLDPAIGRDPRQRDFCSGSQTGFPNTLRLRSSRLSSGLASLRIISGRQYLLGIVLLTFHDVRPRDVEKHTALKKRGD